MKKLSFSVGMFCWLPLIVFADTITLVADAWCPYNCEPSSVSHPGYAVEIAKELFKQAGHQLDYQIVPWTEAVAGTKSGQYTGLICALRRDVPDFIFPEEELGHLSNDFVIRAGEKWKFTNMDSLKSIRLGIVDGYSYGRVLDSYISEKSDSDRVQKASGHQPAKINLNKLLQNNIDVLVEDKDTIVYTAKEMGISNKIVFVGQEGNVVPLYIAFAPNQPHAKDYAKILSEGIKKMREEGQLKEILEKYELSDWK